MAKTETPAASNRKPPDELYDVREKIRELKARESVLRKLLLSGEADFTGDEFRVLISTSKTEKVDTAKLKEELGLKFLRPFLTTSETTYVKIRRLNDD